MKRFITYFLAAPFVLSYAGLILFFYINGVTGADAWVSKFWKNSKAWSLFVALIAGLVMWIIVAIRIIRG